LRSIFDPFLAFAGFMICLFCGTFWPSKVVFGPFLDVFWTVHFITILPRFTPSVELRSVIEPWLAGRRLVQGPAWVYVARIRRISTLLVLAFAINSRNLSRRETLYVTPITLFGDSTGSISIVGAHVSVDLCSLLFLR
jgi:hypothetical protein